MSPDTTAAERSALRSTRPLAWVLALLGLATLAATLLDGRASLTSQAMVYVMAVVVASYMLPRAAALVTAFAAAGLLNFFFMAPRYTFQVDTPENLAALGTMLAVALVISHLGTSLRRETESARLNESRARELQALATELANCTLPLDVGREAQSCLERAFAGPCFLALLREGTLDLSPEAAATCGDGMTACIREGATLGPGTGRWPGLNAWYLPLKVQGHIGGAACVQQVSAYDHAGREHAEAICTLAGQALWRLALAASADAAEQQSHWHQTQNTFLAAISHDFRTPLASIMGAASALQAQRDKLPPGEQERLAGTILAESQHLARLTENTLQLVRLASAGELQVDWQSIEEIVGAVLARVRNRDATHRIRQAVPAGLPLVRADGVLLAQLLENLLDNALKYSSGSIELVVSRDREAIDIAVKDRGPGVAPDRVPAIFEPYRRGDHSGLHGAGLGLALCRAIARAHDGELTLASREGGGTRVVLRLPLPAGLSPGSVS